jgi:signal peptidase I
MVPTLQEGDRFILNRWSFLHRSPKRGELVVVNRGQDDYTIRRVIATPCESVYFKGGEILVNGVPLPEEYLPTGTQTYAKDALDTYLVVGKDRYLVLGDNRTNKSVSGPIRRSDIVGSISREKACVKEKAPRSDFAPVGDDQE